MNTLVKSGDKFFYKLDKQSFGYGGRLLVNGEEMKPSFLEGWAVSDTLPKTVTRITERSFIESYKIKENYKHLNLPEVRQKDDFLDEDGENTNEAYFYDAVFGKEEQREEHEIVFDNIIEEDVQEPMTYVINYTERFGEKKTKVITGQPSMVHAAMFPDIVLASKPTTISGDEFYKLIRHHVKMNINPLYAHVTSDYDFCFTVKKKLAIDPITNVLDGRSGRQRKPRPYTVVTKDREVEVFEMTPPSEKYRGYTPIYGITARNHAELKKKVDEFLDNLMELINEPIESCRSCKGTGVIEPRKFEAKDE